ncbi:hypothetical protein B0T19DRAFT_151010 [Cercophora scortea]|uniref:Uncharacterized protein n=1 Tax=Cercophora scortea TaxID=314031 RepID=A0AAE0IL33_9PEZI|nr:hypothetical protein B0T19DRAFT_151010 [Cercophora scortea]
MRFRAKLLSLLLPSQAKPRRESSRMATLRPKIWALCSGLSISISSCPAPGCPRKPTSLPPTRPGSVDRATQTDRASQSRMPPVSLTISRFGRDMDRDWTRAASVSQARPGCVVGNQFG